MAFTLPALPYAYDALTPYIDEETMRIASWRAPQCIHHKCECSIGETSWVSRQNNRRIYWLIWTASEDIRTAVRNNGGGHANHSLFWTVLAPNAGGEPTGAVKDGIEEAFGGLMPWRSSPQPLQAVSDPVGAWLVVSDGKLKSPPLQTRFTDQRRQNADFRSWCMGSMLITWIIRTCVPEYIKAFWNLVNWDEVQPSFSGYKMAEKMTLINQRIQGTRSESFFLTVN